MKKKLYLKMGDVPAIKVTFLIFLLLIVFIIMTAPIEHKMFVIIFTLAFLGLLSLVFILVNSDNSAQKEARFLILEDGKISVVNKNKTTQNFLYENIQSVEIDGYWGMTPKMTFRGASAKVKINSGDDSVEFITDVMPSVIEFIKEIKANGLVVNYNSKETKDYFEEITNASR